MQGHVAEEPTSVARRPVPRASRTAALAAVGVAAATIAVSSWLSIPFFPVPLTLQTLAVLVVGGVLGVVWGPTAVLVYLGLGAVGLPVFHNGTGGLGVLAGPTGGYLVGFVPAALCMGLAAAIWRRRRLRGIAAVLVLGAGALVATVAIYAVGVPWLAAVAHLSAAKALSVGLVPFIPGDLVKAALAVVVIRAVTVALESEGRLSPGRLPF
jgi:biotin transport system substrate-specific component